jgi:hypothetical protein
VEIKSLHALIHGRSRNRRARAGAHGARTNQRQWVTAALPHAGAEQRRASGALGGRSNRDVHNGAIDRRAGESASRRSEATPAGGRQREKTTGDSEVRVASRQGRLICSRTEERRPTQAPAPCADRTSNGEQNWQKV